MDFFIHMEEFLFVITLEEWIPKNFANSNKWMDFDLIFEL